jgi:hypothetical protein
LQVGLDGAILRCHGVPTRLRPPRDSVQFLGEQIRGWRDLSGPEDLLLLPGHLFRPKADALRAHPDAPIGDFDVSDHVRSGKLVQQAPRCLALVGAERREVDQSK